MSVEPPPTPPPPPSPPPPPGEIRPPTRAVLLGREVVAALRTGWGRSVLAAAVVLAVVYAMNLLLALLQQEAGEQLLQTLAVPGAAGLPETPALGRSALFSMMLWHSVSVDAEIELPPGEVPFAASFDVSATFPLMLGFAITGFLLFRAGRWLAARDPIVGVLSVVRGLQLALPYAVLLFVLGLLTGFEIPIPDTGPGSGDLPQSISITPSAAGSFLMPLLLAGVAGGAGALAGRLRPATRVWTWIHAAVAGGWRAAWVAVSLSIIGFLIVAALNPDVTRAYLDLLPGGGLPRLLLMVSTVLLLPNMGTGIAAAAMGGSINFAAFGDACAFISYLDYPQGIMEAPTSPSASGFCTFLGVGPAPYQYLLFLLVPLAATFVGGWLAAQHAGARAAADGARIGAAIALPYALWLWVLALVARIGWAAAGGFFPFELRVWVGPGLLSAVLLALVWGAAGGAIGGAVAANRSGPGHSPGPPENART